MTEEERMHARVLGNVLAKSTGLDGGALARLEGRHRNVGGNALRAAVLGANDGLCSNLSLVMGIAARRSIIGRFFSQASRACSQACARWRSASG
jgi:VIT1/CCC1 family predicted Fe2+/Mn2+ transporter